MVFYFLQFDAVFDWRTLRHSSRKWGLDRVLMSSIFDLNLQVQAEHIDQLGHVNNVVYMHWSRMLQQHILMLWVWA